MAEMMESASARNVASIPDDQSLPEPDYDHLDLSFASMMEDDEDDLKKGLKKDNNLNPQYIVGTLIVRVVAARDLDAVQKSTLGNFLARPSSNRSRGSANPYASVKFMGQTQRTTECFDTVDPVWPRGETMFMDVSLPLSHVSHRLQEEAAPPVTAAASAAATAAPPAQSSAPFSKPVLSVAMFHFMGGNLEKYPTKKGNSLSGDSDEPFLGMMSVDVTPLLTGKITTLDRWMPLTGTAASSSSKGEKMKSRGSVRIVVEYEASDPSPRPGDIVRFSRFINVADLYPVPPCDAYRVDEVVGDNILLQYPTPEGWLCTFQAHRFMLICEERHQGAVEIAHEELATLAERLGQSPLIHTVTETVDRLPDEGLMSIGLDAVRGGASLLERWMKGGLQTATQDIVYATNFDGRFNSADAATGEAPIRAPASANTGTSSAQSERLGRLKVPQDEEEEEEGEALPGMPSCPITGSPMIDPVVAADGHTYERAAIARWLQTSDRSPLTGAVLAHKELVTNYMLLSSLQESIEIKQQAETNRE